MEFTINKKLEECLVIPARLASTRLKNKVILNYKGLPIFVHVVKNCQEAYDGEVIVLTPDKHIVELCKKFNINYYMTSTNCQTGTDRVIEFSQNNKYKRYICVQADEPLLSSANIEIFIKKTINIDAIGISLIKNFNELKNISFVKIIQSKSSKLLYATRKLNFINPNLLYYRHIGIYSYLYDTLKIFEKDKTFTIYETENIEILKLLENDIDVKCIDLSHEGFAIDTIGDYRKLKKGTGL